MKLRDQALAQSRAAGFCPHRLPVPASPRYPVEDGYCDNGFLGWRSRPAGIIRSRITRAPGTRIGPSNYGGFDNPDPSRRHDYIPVIYVPRQNPFYCALPYNDVSHGQFKPEAPMVVPWFRQAYVRTGAFGLQGPLGRDPPRQPGLLRAMGRLRTFPHRSLPIRFPERAAETEPEPRRRSRCLAGGARLSRPRPTDVTDWQFVEVRDVPPGPWRNYGDNNNFVIAKRQAEARLVQQTRRGHLALVGAASHQRGRNFSKVVSSSLIRSTSS